jgi:hypothetical protein
MNFLSGCLVFYLAHTQRGVASTSIKPLQRRLLDYLDGHDEPSLFNRQSGTPLLVSPSRMLHHCHHLTVESAVPYASRCCCCYVDGLEQVLLESQRLREEPEQ